MARPPARGRIPPVEHEPERPRETQEGTSLTPTVDVTYSGAEGRRYGRGEALLDFPRTLGQALAMPPWTNEAWAWDRAKELLADVRTRRASKVADWLNAQGMPDTQWDKVHELIEERHPCSTGEHEVCGCQVHQAWCPCISTF